MMLHNHMESQVALLPRTVVPFRARPLSRLPIRVNKGNLPGRGIIGRPRQHATATSSSSDHNASNASTSFASLPVSQQSLSMAFQILDKDEDGRISRGEACRLVAYYLALQQYKPPPAHRRPLTWDQHLRASISTANKLSNGSWAGVAAACEAYVGAKLSGGLQAHPPRCSDLVWGALGMAAAVMVLGVLAAGAKTLPVVGHWHQQGVPLLLGSFGTLAILLFGKPEAEPVRLWPIIAGQLGATVIVMAVLQACGASLVSRAAAMAATVAWMMWGNCIHPPGGALVLMAMDNAAIQAMSWHYLLWPSLALSLTVLLPISAATNWLRRIYQFDAPWDTDGAATLQQKVQEWREQQAAKQKAVLRQFRALEIDRGLGEQLAVHEELHSPLARLRRVLAPILQLISFPKPVHQPQLQQRWGVLASAQRQLRVRGFNLDLGMLNLGGSITDAGPAEAAAAAALDAAIRRRLFLEQERKLEEREHNRRIWGGSAQLPGVRKVKEDIERLHQQRMQQQQQQQQAQESKNGHMPTPSPPSPQQQGQSEQQQQQLKPSQGLPESLKAIQQRQQGQQGQQQGQQGPVEHMASPRQRLEQHWGLAAHLPDESTSRHTRGMKGAMDSFAPEEE